MLKGSAGNRGAFHSKAMFEAHSVLSVAHRNSCFQTRRMLLYLWFEHCTCIIRCFSNELLFSLPSYTFWLFGEVKSQRFRVFSCLTFYSFQAWPGEPCEWEQGWVYVSWCPGIWKGRKPALYNQYEAEETREQVSGRIKSGGNWK